jgi:hypothetical protein
MSNGHRYDCFTIYALVHAIVIFYGNYIVANLLFKCTFKPSISIFFHIHTSNAHLDIIKVFYLPTDAQVNCLKNDFKIYVTLKYTLHCSDVDFLRVQRTHTNKDPLIYAAKSPHTDVL